MAGLPEIGHFAENASSFLSACTANETAKIMRAARIVVRFFIFGFLKRVEGFQFDQLLLHSRTTECGQYNNSIAAGKNRFRIART